MKFLSLLLFLTSFCGIYAYQWPSNTDYLSSLFGSVSNEYIQDGIKFQSEGQAIYPLTDGEIIYYQESFQFGDLDYVGREENILVLKHVGEFKSIYRNFSSTDDFDQKTNINKDEMIGVSRGGFKNFIFSIYDDKRDSYINPQQILPFLEDSNKPIISDVYLKNDIEYIKLTQNNKVFSGVSSIYINAWDVVKIRNAFKKFTPFSVNVFVDGFERYSASFSSLKEVDEVIYLLGDTDIPISDLLSGGQLLFGGEIFLTNGRSLIEVVIRDIDGNEATKSYSVNVD